MKRDTFGVSIGLAHELVMAFVRCGWNATEMKKLTKGTTLKKIRNLPGLLKPPVIHLSRNQYISKAIVAVHKHIVDIPFEWDPSKVSFKLFGKQKKKEGSVCGMELWKEMEKLPVFNANLLDYLIGNPYLIPEEWKVTSSGEIRYIFFWGTTFLDEDSRICVACLYWNGYYWDKGYKFILTDWLSNEVSAVRVLD